MQDLSAKFHRVHAQLPGELFNNKDYVGIRIDETGTNLVIMVTHMQREDSLLLHLQTSQSFMSVLKAESLALSVEVTDIPRPQAVLAGSPGFGSGLSSWGTLGWFIVLDRQVVCVSNHHVLCARGDNTPIGTPVYSGYPNSARKIGVLSYYDLLATANPRLFDFALARIDDVGSISAEFVPCSDGTSLPYPRRLGLDSDLDTSDMYATVGARLPTCVEGRFRGIASSMVGPYAGGAFYYFTEQLLFDPITSPGDSGSIIFNKRTGAVIGLVFAGNEGVRTLANPLYRKGWTYIGTKVVGSAEVPEFESAAREPATSLLKTLDSPPDLNSSPLPPFFQAGRRFNSWPSLLALRDSFNQSHRIISEFAILQPRENWAEVRVTHDSGNSFISNPVTTSAWLYVPTGVVYV